MIQRENGRLSYINFQLYDVSPRFSVRQRRFAWTLRQHPKAFVKRNGMSWTFVLQPMTAEQYRKAAEKGIEEYLTTIHAFYDEKRKARGAGV